MSVFVVSIYKIIAKIETHFKKIICMWGNIYLQNLQSVQD